MFMVPFSPTWLVSPTTTYVPCTWHVKIFFQYLVLNTLLFFSPTLNSTLTKSVSFEECLIAIKDNAFVTSDYPVIITIEDHMGPDLQNQAAIVSLNIGVYFSYISRFKNMGLIV